MSNTLFILIQWIFVILLVLISLSISITLFLNATIEFINCIKYNFNIEIKTIVKYTISIFILLMLIKN